MPRTREVNSEAIKRLRDERGWSQEELVSQIGKDICLESIKNAEKPGHKMYREKIRLIARAFDVDASEIEMADDEGENCYIRRCLDYLAAQVKHSDPDRRIEKIDISCNTSQFSNWSCHGSQFYRMLVADEGQFAANFQLRHSGNEPAVRRTFLVDRNKIKLRSLRFLPCALTQLIGNGIQVRILFLQDLDINARCVGDLGRIGGACVDFGEFERRDACSSGGVFLRMRDELYVNDIDARLDYIAELGESGITVSTIAEIPDAISRYKSQLAGARKG